VARVEIGDTAPDFELQGTGGRTYRLSKLRGRTVVLAFYPGDDTRVCTAQFCSYRDRSDRLERIDAEVLGISPQSVDSHERWTEQRDLTLPLLADEDLEVSRAYGVLGWAGPFAKLAGIENAPGGRYVMRSIFVIDADGIVRYKHVSRLGATFQTVDDIERAVAALS